MKYVIVCLFFVGSACSGPQMMQPKEFNSIHLGLHTKELVETAGPPNEIRELQAGMKEYVYIERQPIGGGREIFREYILLVSPDGRVINKRVSETKPSSVNMQF